MIPAGRLTDSTLSAVDRPEALAALPFEVVIARWHSRTRRSTSSARFRSSSCTGGARPDRDAARAPAAVMLGASFGPLSRASPPHDAVVGRLSRERRSEGNRRQRLTLSLCRLLYHRWHMMPGTPGPEDRPIIGSSFGCDRSRSLSDCNSTFEVKARDRVLTRMSRPIAKGASTRSGSVFSQLGHLFKNRRPQK